MNHFIIIIIFFLGGGGLRRGISNNSVTGKDLFYGVLHLIAARMCQWRVAHVICARGLGHVR